MDSTPFELIDLKGILSYVYASILNILARQLAKIYNLINFIMTLIAF